MARKSSKPAPKSDDWKSKFINVSLSPNDEKEVAQYVAKNGIVGLGDLVTEIVENGGSVKFTHSKNDGSVYVTVSVDANDSDYGGYLFGIRYANVAGAIALLDWFYHVMLQSDRGLSYLPTTLSDWLGLA